MGTATSPLQMPKRIATDIFVDGRFYGTLRIPMKGILATTDNEICRYVEEKLPLLKGKKYKLMF